MPFSEEEINNKDAFYEPHVMRALNRSEEIDTQFKTLLAFEKTIEEICYSMRKIIDQIWSDRLKESEKMIHKGGAHASS